MELDALLALPKVELHLHLDGAIRHSTLLELAQRKGIDLGGAKTVEEVKRVLVTHRPSSLVGVLSAFEIYLPCVIGDADAIERIAYELCEDQSKNNVLYFEARFSPRLLATPDYPATPGAITIKTNLDATGVVDAALRGLKRGKGDFGVASNVILCCIQGHGEWNDELLELAIKYHRRGVVGVDVAGTAKDATEQYEPSVLKVFHEAARLGIPRTAHAGESGGSESVVKAIEVMAVSRIGHGYHLLRDAEAYAKYALPGKIHFEGCPLSSVMTGSAPMCWRDHPMLRWATDGVNFSINTDDPTCFDNSLIDELKLARHELGLSLEQIKQCQINAAKASFLPDDEKAELVKRLSTEYARQIPN